jgi:cell wall-associated NlpC family hydrolase
MKLSIEEVLKQRKSVVDEAITWMRTPYYHGNPVKGSGVSCSWFVAAVYNNALGIHLEVPDHSEQWWLNNAKELYLEGLNQQGFIQIKKEEVKDGDVAVSRFAPIGYCPVYNHSGIITKWPEILDVADGWGVRKARNIYSNFFFGSAPDEVQFYSWGEWH